MRRSKALYGALLSCSMLLPAIAYADAGNRVLISQDDVTVTEEDLERYIEVRIPERQRMAALDRPGAVRELIGQLFIIRALARNAEEEIDVSDPELQWQIDFQRDRVLMDALIQQAIAADSARVEWATLAEEHYRANIEEFATEERARASHVLIGTDERTEDEARALAEEIAGRARAGEDFAELAREYSDDPSVERNAGDLGRFTRGRMVPEFEEAAFALSEEGEVSDPVQTQFGFHVIRLHSRQDSSVRPFEQVRDRIIRELQEKQASDVRQEIVERVRVDGRIEVNHEAVAELEESLRVERSGRASRDVDAQTAD